MKKQDKFDLQNGFTLLISVILVSAFLMAAVLQNTQIVGVLFEEARLKQERISAVGAAAACLDRAVLALTHDYFLSVSSSSPWLYPALHCSVESAGPSAGYVFGGGYETVTVSGSGSTVTNITDADGLTATIVAQFFLSNQNISLLSQKTFF